MKFSCPACGQHLDADANYVGLTIECPACNGPLLVPGVKAMRATVAVAAPAPRAVPFQAVRGLQRTSALAVWSLVLSLASFLVGPFGFLPAIICGHLAKGAIRRDPSLAGQGLATAGLAVGYVFLVLMVAVAGLWIGLGPQAARMMQAHQ
jgi:Domain of unknown function (DUF4190)